MTQTTSMTPASQEPAVIQLMRTPEMIEQIKAALPRHLTPDRFARMMLTCLRNTPKLLDCDQRSFLSGMMELAQLGLECGTPLGHAWMLPYGATAQVIIGYKGMIALAERGARISMNAEAVYEGDEFQYALGTEPFIQHSPTEDIGARGPLKYAYSIARYPDNRPCSMKVVNQADIDSAKQSSSAWKAGQTNKARRDSPWYTQEASMWRKTAIRRHSAFLPLSAEFHRVMQLDAQEESGDRQVFTPTGLTLPPPDPADEAKRLETELAGISEVASGPPEPDKPHAETIGEPPPLTDAEKAKQADFEAKAGGKKGGA